MNITEAQPVIQNISDIEVELDELALKLRTGAMNSNIMNLAGDVLDHVAGTWNPTIVYRWCRCQRERNVKNVYSILCNGNKIKINLGYSGQFLQGAEHVLLAAYTAGDELEKAGQAATEDGRFLEAYIIDMIGLLALEKTGMLVKQTAQRQALDTGWGVSPFLSPGSVHGWNLEEQSVICSLLPLDEAGLKLQEDCILRPFKSLSCLIGIGPGYTSATVGDTCRVCTKRAECQMR